MKTNTITVTIEGTSPLLMSRYPGEVKGIAKKEPAEIAEISAYRDPQGGLCVPGVNIWRALVQGAAHTKKGKSSLKRDAAGGLTVTPELVALGTKEYNIDARSIVNPSTGGRSMCYRARLEHWKLTFDLTYEETLFSLKDVNKIIEDTGERVGLLSFRPEKMGWFGKFRPAKH